MDVSAEVVAVAPAVRATAGALRPGELVALGPAADPHGWARVVGVDEEGAVLRLRRGSSARVGDDVTVLAADGGLLGAASTAPCEARLAAGLDWWSSSRPQTHDALEAACTRAGGRLRASVELLDRYTLNEGAHLEAGGELAGGVRTRWWGAEVIVGAESWVRDTRDDVLVHPVLGVGGVVGARDGAWLYGAFLVSPGRPAPLPAMVHLEGALPLFQRVDLIGDVDIAFVTCPGTCLISAGVAAWVVGVGGAGSVGIDLLAGLERDTVVDDVAGFEQLTSGVGRYVGIRTRMRW